MAHCAAALRSGPAGFGIVPGHSLGHSPGHSHGPSLGLSPGRQDGAKPIFACQGGGSWLISPHVRRGAACWLSQAAGKPDDTAKNTDLVNAALIVAVGRVVGGQPKLLRETVRNGIDTLCHETDTIIKNENARR